MATLNYAFKELSCKIVYYGCGLCGKTTNLIHIHKTVPQKFRGELVSLATEQDRTLFFDFLPLDLGEVKGFKTKFQLYTVPGQVYYNATRKLVLRGVDGLVFVADSQKDRLQENIDSLENLKQNLAEYGYRLQTGPSDFEGIPWVIQYNKRDMPQVSELEDMQVAMNPNRVPHFEAVAVNGNGVKDTLKGISSLVIKKLNADPTGVGGTAEPKKESKPVAAAATPSSKAPVAEDYSAMNEDDLAKELAEEPKSKSAAAASSTPAMSRPKPAAPAPVAEAPAAHAGMPVLNVVQKGGARVRGLGFGSSNLTLANMAGGDADLYQLTGKVSFLGIFGSTWSRRLRFTGTEEKAYGGVVSKFFKFLSDDGTDPSLEVYVKDDFDKPLFVNYLGKFGEVKIVPPGKAPLA